MFASICSLQTYDKASAAQLSNYPRRNQSFFHSPFFSGMVGQWRAVGFPLSAYRRAGRVQAPLAPGFYRSCADALTDEFRPQSGLVQRGGKGFLRCAPVRRV